MWEANVPNSDACVTRAVSTPHLQVQRLLNLTNYDVQSNPEVHASVQDSMVAVFISSQDGTSQLVLFDSGSCESQCVGLSHSVDCSAWSSDGLFLLLALSNGALNLVYTPDGTTVVCRQAMPAPEEGEPAFCSVDMNTEAITVVGTHSKILRFTNLQFELMTELLGGGKFEEASKLQEGMIFEDIDVLDGMKLKTAVSFQHCGSDHLIATTWDRQIALVNLSTKVVVVQEHYLAETPIKKVIPIPQHGYVIGLTECGCLHMFLMELLVVCDVWQEHRVTDFSWLGESSGKELSFLLLTSDHQIRVAVAPGFVIEHSVAVNRLVTLPHFPSGQDRLFFLEGHEDEDTGIVTEVCLQEVTEGTLEMRMERLLRHARFTEAEKMAMTFNMDMQQVQKEAAMYALAKWGPDSTLPQLLETLDRIQDVSFVMDQCASTLLTSHEDTRDLWIYGAKRGEQVNDKSQLAVKKQLWDQLYQLETIQLLWDTNDSSSFDLWQQFYRSDLVYICQQLLYDGELDRAIVIWQRHPSCKSHVVSEDSAESLLMPALHLPCDILLQWLAVLLPGVAVEHIEALPHLLTLVHDMAKNLEFKEPKQWPRNALDFLEKIVAILKETGKTTFDPLAPLDLLTYFAQDDVFQRTYQLISGLKDLEELDDKYGVVVTLGQYLQDDKLSVVVLMLESMMDDANIPSFVANFLKPFVKKHGLHIKDALLHYIEESVCIEEFNLAAVTSWESRLLSLYKCIEDVQTRAKAVLSIVQKAPIPWSERIASLAESGGNFPTPYGEQISMQKKLVSVKQVMRKYGKWHFDLDSIGQSQTMVQYILKQNGKDSVKDAGEVARFSNCFSVDLVFAMRLKTLMEEGDEANLEEFLLTVRAERRAGCCRRFLSLIASKFVLLADDERKEQYVLLRDFILPRLSKWLDWGFCEEWVDFLERLPPEDLQILLPYKLIKRQRDCGIPVTVTEKCVESTKEDILECMLNGSSVLLCYQKALEVAYILRISPIQVASKVALQLAKKGKGTIGIGLLSFLEPFVPNQPAADILAEAIPLLLTDWLQQRDPSQLPSIMNYASYSATYCSPAHLALMSWMSKLCQLLVDLHHTVADISDQRDPYEEWSFEGIYEDISLHYMDCDLSPLVKWLVDVAVIMQCELQYGATPGSTTALLSPPPFGNMITLMYHGQNFLTLRVLQVLITAQTLLGLDFGVPNPDTVTYMEKLVTVLLEKIICAEEPDITLAYGLLCGIPLEKVASLLQSGVRRLGSDPHHLLSLSRLGMEFEREEEVFQQYSLLHLRAQWGLSLAHFNLDGIGCFLTGEKRPSHILRQLISRTDAKLQTICQFCNDFSIDIGAALEGHLTYLLHDCPINIDSDGNSNIYAIVERAESVWEKLSVQIGSSSSLVKLFRKVSPYNYEALSWMLNAISAAPSSPGFDISKFIKTGSELLAFLRNYERRSLPGEHEKLTELEGNNPAKVLATTRLPFHQMLQKEVVCKIINKELSLNNINLWLQLSVLLKQPADTLCAQAIQNSVQECLEQGSEDLMDEVVTSIEHCVQHIKDVSLALACVNTVTNKLPLGRAKVKAARLRVKMAESALRIDSSEHSRLVLQKMSSRLRELSVELILQENRIDSPQFLELIGKPEDLIMALYKSCDPLNSNVTVEEISCLKNVVMDISEKVSTPLSQFQMRLLEEWLHLASQLAPNGEGFAMYLAKIIVLLPRDADSLCLMHMMSVAMDAESPAPKRLCTMICLWTNEESRQKLMDYDGISDEAELRHDIMVLYHSVRLGSLRTAYPPEALKVVNKGAVIWSVLRTQGANQKAITVLVNFALDFGIDDQKLWGILYSHLKTLPMGDLLAHVKQRIPVLVKQLEK